MRIAALGRTRLLYDSIRLLHEHGHQVALIGTCRAAPEYDVKASDFEALAKELSVPFFNDARINAPENIQTLRSAMADIAISVNWLTIVGKDAVNAFPHGILNAHAGDLPRYRGNACPNWALLNGEAQIGVTIHKMAPDELDSGDIVLKEYLSVNRDTRIGEIYDYLGEAVPKLFLRAVNGLESGSITPVEQSRDPQLALRCYPRVPSDSRIDWSRPAEDILRLINASSEPFQGAYTFLNMNRLVIWRASREPFQTPSLYIPGQVAYIDRDGGSVGVAANDGVVVLREVQLEDGGRVRPADIIRSTRARLGMNTEDELYRLHKLLNACLGGSDA